MDETGWLYWLQVDHFLLLNNLKEKRQDKKTNSCSFSAMIMALKIFYMNYWKICKTLFVSRIST